MEPQPGPLQQMKKMKRLLFPRGLKVLESDGFKSSRAKQMAVDEKVIIFVFITNLNH